MRIAAWRVSAGWLIALLVVSCTPPRLVDRDRPWQKTALGLCEDYREETRSLDAARRDLAVARDVGARVLRVAFGWDASEVSRSDGPRPLAAATI